MDPASDLEWEGRDWFGKRRRLWIGTQNGTIATLGWWCGKEEASRVFYPIPEGSEILIHAIVLPEYRRKNLHVLLRRTLLQMRVADGVRAFYVHCRDYNTFSYHNILKMGFKPVGYTVKPRFPRRSAKRIEIKGLPPP
jgi:hypothetical protein